MSDWIGVDFDGTLAHSGTGAPVPAMVERVKRMLADGKRVKIFTARADRGEDIKQIADWLTSHGLPPLTITNIKDSEMVAFYDDRAIAVERNTGAILGGKE